MQTYSVRLESKVFKSFRCQSAANSLDIDAEKKSVHELKIEADLKTPFKIGLVLGASGSGKTTLVKQIYGEDCFEAVLDPELPIIEQFPKSMSYPECAEVLLGIGLTAVPCWIRPVKTLSNGQRARAEAALLMVRDSDKPILIDEWTSVVDRTVAKVMSHCLAKFAKKKNRQIILCSCHYDVVEWLDPDWVIDCNEQRFTDRRSLRPDKRKRQEQLRFSIREIGLESWKYFSRYHYLSDAPPKGLNKAFGLFNEDGAQVGFVSFMNYVPARKNKKIILHSNRLVIHPDYAGIGLGLRFVDECADFLHAKHGYRIMAKFSSLPMYYARIKSPKWKLITRDLRISHKNNVRMGVFVKTIRSKVRTFTFEFIYDSSSISAVSPVIEQSVQRRSVDEESFI